MVRRAALPGAATLLPFLFRVPIRKAGYVTNQRKRVILSALYGAGAYLTLEGTMETRRDERIGQCCRP